MLSSSTLKQVVVGSLPTGQEPNGSQPKAAPFSLPMLKFNKTLQLKGKEKELHLQETTADAVSRRELIGLAATTLGGLALFATEPAEALEVADIGSSLKELLGISKAKPKTGAENQKNPKVENDKKPKMDDKGKPRSEGDLKKPKVEDNGKKPKSETDEKKSKMEGNVNKPKSEADEKKPKIGDDKKAVSPHHSEKEKVSSSSPAAPTLPNILNNAVH
ncbi:protein PXR1-like [Nicotiana sylvestris]|uniref:Histone H1-I-like n=2 Tax=Nicotiana TaxID=4085 RepID=A0A1S4B8D1_TOBAC|nr:PREDICTED: histone H1-I-like [Nicotiana sylvestris]XP_016485146.1 PREDICTED: histone H1-I-like [Nicotiana tabacum]